MHLLKLPALTRKSGRDIFYVPVQKFDESATLRFQLLSDLNERRVSSICDELGQHCPADGGTTTHGGGGVSYRSNWVEVILG